MASFDFDSLSDAARKVFLAGVGAIAVGAEKTADVVNDLVEKGELTVEQGKAVNEELKHKAAEATSGASDAVLRARLKKSPTTSMPSPSRSRSKSRPRTPSSG